MILFAAFAGVSGAGVWLGEERCSCFGELPVRPWQALVLDLVCMVLLLSACPGHATPEAQHNKKFRTTVRVAGVLGAFVLVAGLDASGALRPVYHQLLPWIDREGTRQARLMLGRPWRSICGSSIDGQLAAGRWVVLLFKPGCSRCERALARCLMTIDSLRSGPSTHDPSKPPAHGETGHARDDEQPHTRLAVLVVRGMAWAPEPWWDTNELVVGELAGGQCLQMAPPLVVRLEDGIVKEIAHDCSELR